MLSIMLAALLNTATFVAPGAPAATRLPFGKADSVVSTRLRADEEHLLKAHKAMADGAFEMARREFIIAAALDRADGKLPTKAVVGLAHVLYGQNRERDAARVLDELADEALAANDVDCAALALQDALWLHLQAGRKNETKVDAVKLNQLLTSRRLSDSVQKQIRSRFQ